MGNCTVINDGNNNWRVKLLSTGSKTLKFAGSTSIDAFLVGGGGAGGFPPGAENIGQPNTGGGGGGSSGSNGGGASGGSGIVVIRNAR